MSTNRSTSEVNLADFDVQEQIQEFERFRQMREDMELARRLGDQVVAQAPQNAQAVAQTPHNAPRMRQNTPGPVSRHRQRSTNTRHVESSPRPSTSGIQPNTPSWTRQRGRLARQPESSELTVIHEDRPSTSTTIATINLVTPERPSTSSRRRSIGDRNECVICFTEQALEPRGCPNCIRVIGCKSCVLTWIQQAENPSCPLCRQKWARANPGIVGPSTLRKRLQTLTRNG